MIVKSQVLKLPEPFITEKGGVIKEAAVAYEEYGKKEEPTIFITHGGLSSQHAAGRYSAQDPLPGFWNDLIGPEKAIDTDRFRVLCANSLGSMYGSSSSLTLNPDTGKPYGPDFPEITLIDMVRYHKAFLDQLGVSRLFMMAGPSMGSLQALQMAALYPDFIDSVVAVATAGRMTPSGMCIHHFMINALQMDPEFNNGRYEIGTPKLAIRLIQQVARIYYTHERFVKERCWDSVPEGKNSQEKIIDSPWGHMGCVQEGKTIGKHITDFLMQLRGAGSTNCG